MDIEYSLPIPFPPELQEKIDPLPLYVDPALQVLNKDFLASLRKAPSPALDRATRGATAFIMAQLLSGFVMWGRTYRLYRKVMRNRHSLAKIRFARQELRIRLRDRVECRPRMEYLIGVNPGRIPRNVPLYIS